MAMKTYIEISNPVNYTDRHTDRGEFIGPNFANAGDQ